MRGRALAVLRASVVGDARVVEISAAGPTEGEGAGLKCATVEMRERVDLRSGVQCYHGLANSYLPIKIHYGDTKRYAKSGHMSLQAHAYLFVSLT